MTAEFANPSSCNC